MHLSCLERFLSGHVILISSEIRIVIQICFSICLQDSDQDFEWYIGTPFRMLCTLLHICFRISIVSTDLMSRLLSGYQHFFNFMPQSPDLTVTSPDVSLFPFMHSNNLIPEHPANYTIFFFRAKSGNFYPREVFEPHLGYLVRHRATL